MQGFVIAWLLALLTRRRKTTYTAWELGQIRLEAAQREGGQKRIEAPKRPYKWWRYEGLF
jgi:hypothetical protein